ncbi:MAG: class I SAM-dependent methyltransferase [Roseiarcus sp.]
MGSPASHEGNADQAAYWNGPGGRQWTDRQELQDAVLAPVSDVLFEHAAIAPGERILDIGCGCGATTLEAARRVGPAGAALGLDLSEAMLARARARTPAGAPVSFVVGDASIYSFPPGRADLLMSRFGVMFFADPAASFANMRAGLRHGGRVALACWREPRLNPWLMLPLHEAYKFAPRLPELGPEDPGPFAFASRARVDRVLGEAGFSEFAAHPVDMTLDIAVGRGLDAAVEGALAIGPASRALEDQPAAARAAAAAAIRAALAPFRQGGRVALGAAIWIVTAVNR